MLPPFIYEGFKLIRNTKIFHFSVLITIFILSLIPSILFHYLYFGSPFSTPYSMRSFSIGAHPKYNIANEFDILRSFKTLPHMLLFFDPRSIPITSGDTDYFFRYYKSSLLQSSPFLVLSLFGFYFYYKMKKKEKILLLVLLLSCTIFTLGYSSWIYWGGGWCTNMRYLSPLLPFLSIFSSFAIYHLILFNIKRKILVLSFLFFVFLVILSTFLSKQPTDLKQIWNLINFVLAIGLFIGYCSILYKPNYQLTKKIFSTFLILSILGAFMMIYLLDNLILFNGSPSTLFILNFRSSLITAILFTLTLSYVICRILFDKVNFSS